MCRDFFPWGQTYRGGGFGGWVKKRSQEKEAMAPSFERREKSVQIILRRRTLKLNAGHGHTVSILDIRGND